MFMNDENKRHVQAIKITRETTNNQWKKYNSVKHIQGQQFSFRKTSIKVSLKILSLQASSLMYRSNRSFNMPPRAVDFFEIFCSNSPLPGPRFCSNAPTPGTFYRHKNDRRTAETPSVVEQNLYKCNKNWETRLAYLLRTKVSCKAAEIAPTMSLNAQCNIQSVV